MLALGLLGSISSTSLSGLGLTLRVKSDTGQITMGGGDKVTCKKRIVHPRERANHDHRRALREAKTG